MWRDFWGHRTRKRRQAMNTVKAQIKLRLKNEDYTCRLPRDPKPRVRYKLRLKVHRHPHRWSKTYQMVYK